MVQSLFEVHNCNEYWKIPKKKFAFLSFYALTKVPIEYFYVVIVGTWCVSKFHALLISRALEEEIKKICRKMTNNLHTFLHLEIIKSM